MDWWHTFETKVVAALLLFLVVLMDFHAEGFTVSSLIPSQVIGHRETSRPRSTTIVIPSQFVKSSLQSKQDSSSRVVEIDTTTSNNETAHHHHHHHRRGRRKPKKKSANKKDVPSGAEAIPGQRNSTQNVVPFAREGNQPDIYWRAVSMEHIRQHPKFEPLPLPTSIRKLDSLEDARLFRQDSWQWDTLHHGRCTTSQAVAALGFLEHMTGEVPASWRRGGRGAFQRLRQEGLRTLEQMNRILCSDDAPDLKVEQPDVSCWSPSSESAFHSAYNHTPSPEEMEQRKQISRRLGRNVLGAKSVRVSWGTTQEATALLAALNYFVRHDPGLELQEVGMCGAGLSLRQLFHVESSLLVGATPDALLVHSSGQVEVLEVKNHCPFVSPFIGKGKARSGKLFYIGDRPFEAQQQTIFSHYIPQLMMEMLCVGPECRSAVMIRLTATKGALLLRLHRDDHWIAEMIHFLDRFQRDFVEKNCPPRPNFFLVDTDKHEAARYRRFLNRTMEVKNTVEVIGYIPHDLVQRVPVDSPLFLD